LSSPTGWPARLQGRGGGWRWFDHGDSFRVFPVLPLRARWIARITEFEWNHFFADVQEKGPFKNWRHRHQFLAETRSGIAGTVVRDVIDYEVGFGFVGAMIDAVFVRRQMQNTFAQRQEV
jgi:ligand-binding SRPBCC domain-containing protein